MVHKQQFDFQQLNQEHANSIYIRVIEAASEIATRYGITSLSPLIKSCRSLIEEEELTIAIFGRFKAGKSSFLNSFLGRDLLPVGVVPVTTVITDIGYGPRERAQVHYLDGRIEDVALDDIRTFIAESDNPGNRKGVGFVRVELPSLHRFRAIRLIDTPGLESVLTHNTEVTRSWLPNVGLAIVAVGVDPPLSSQDIELLQELYEYTPHISLLVTKVDVVTQLEQAEVLAFVKNQLGRHLETVPKIYPFSIRLGFEELRKQLEEQVFVDSAKHFDEQRMDVLAHKVETLLQECGDYLRLALKSAENVQTDRESLKNQIIGKRESIEEVKTGLRLLARHIAGGVRNQFADKLNRHQAELEESLLRDMESRFPTWATSMANVTTAFQEWLRESLTHEMGRLSALHRHDFVGPITKLEAQLAQAIQDFQNRLSARALDSLGVHLRTSVIQVKPEEPKWPDVRVGKIFDHTWELLSFLIPMWLVRSTVKRHFEHKIRSEVYTNLSRLASQWNDVVTAPLNKIEKQAENRLDEFIATVERLISSTEDTAKTISEDLERLANVRSGPTR